MNLGDFSRWVTPRGRGRTVVPKWDTHSQGVRLSEGDRAGEWPQLRAAPAAVETGLTCLGSGTSGCRRHRRKTRALAVPACPAIVPMFQGWFSSHSEVSPELRPGLDPSFCVHPVAQPRSTGLDQSRGQAVPARSPRPQGREGPSRLGNVHRSADPVRDGTVALAPRVSADPALTRC